MVYDGGFAGKTGGSGGSRGGGGSWFDKFSSNKYASAIFGGIGAALTSDPKDTSNAQKRQKAIRDAEAAVVSSDIIDHGDFERARGGNAPSIEDMAAGGGNAPSIEDVAADYEKDLIQSPPPITPEIKTTLDFINMKNQQKNQLAMMMPAQPPTAKMTPERKQQLGFWQTGVHSQELINTMTGRPRQIEQKARDAWLAGGGIQN